MKYIVFLSLILTLVTPLYASDWWNDSWDYRKEFSLNTTSDGLTISRSLNDVTVLVKLHTGNFSYFTDVGLNAENVQFVSDQNQPLAHHTEYFDAEQQIGLFWIKIPRINPDSLQKFYMYYGSDETQPIVPSTATYTDKDILVYHFDHDIKDAGQYSNHADNELSTYVRGAAIGTGIEFLNAENISSTLNPALDLSTAQGGIISLWARIDDVQSDAVLVNLKDTNNHQLVLKIQELQLTVEGINSDSKLTEYIRLEDKLELNTWYHIAVSVNAQDTVLYVNAEEYKSNNSSPVSLINRLSIGAHNDGSNAFVGQMDEVHIHKHESIQNRVSLAYANQGVNDVLLQVGGDVQHPSLLVKHNPLMFSISKLSLEGKVTTTILMIMLMLGLYIMLIKSIFISRVKKGNSIFSQQFSSQMFKPVEIADSSITYSTLNHIHRQAIQELSARLDQSTALSSNAIVTIRSSMNTAMLRQTQKLNKQMVLLTIAIAGGPFIGLLGTVMGVMITFADVALAGNVDVNAIAPGISAALVATVAGLLVAIPCLFGYNYLSAQIKEIVGDMRVFVDAFQASITERYSE